MRTGSRLLRKSNNLGTGGFQFTEGLSMADRQKAREEIEAIWQSGKVTRRRLIGYGAAAAGALGATMLVPARGQAAFGQAKPYKIGTLQPLSGAGAAGGKTGPGGGTKA